MADNNTEETVLTKLRSLSIQDNSHNQKPTLKSSNSDQGDEPTASSSHGSNSEDIESKPIKKERRNTFQNNDIATGEEPVITKVRSLSIPILDNSHNQKSQFKSTTLDQGHEPTATSTRGSKTEDIESKPIKKDRLRTLVINYFNYFTKDKESMADNNTEETVLTKLRSLSIQDNSHNQKSQLKFLNSDQGYEPTATSTRGSKAESIENTNPDHRQDMSEPFKPEVNVGCDCEFDKSNIGSTSSEKNKPNTTDESENVYLFNILRKVDNAIQTGDLDNLKQLIKIIYNTCDKTLLSSIYFENGNPVRNTHLITIACKYKQPHILNFLLNESDIMQYLPNKGPVVEKAYKQAFCETILSQNIEMLEMLYDYWSGDVHWPVSTSRTMADIIPNLKFLKKLLHQSHKRCEKILEGKLLVDVYSLISFNNFQLKLYEKLFNLNIVVDRKASDEEVRKSEVEAIKTLILNAYKIYEDAVNYKQTHSDYHNYHMFDILNRKLDSNIALLILNNIHLLKQRLVMPNNAYQDIECALYYFLYEVSDKWSLFLRRNRLKENDLKHNFGLDIPKNNPYRFLNQPVIYYKWIAFRKAVARFVSTLNNVKVDVGDNLRSRIPKEEINSLTLLPHIRDDYSLKKMLNYMNAIAKVDFEQDRERGAFVVQRILQVLGELVKHSSNHDTCHLSPTTRALLRSEMPENILKIIEDIRDSSLSRARQGTLLRRIDLEINEFEIFEDLVTDILEIKRAIKAVTRLYKPVLEISMYTAGIKLLNSAYDELEKQDDEEHWAELFGVPVESSGFVYANITHLCEMRDRTKVKNWTNVAAKQSIYTTPILQKLEEIEQHNIRWNTLKKDLSNTIDIQSLSDYPNEEGFKGIKEELEKEIKKAKLNLNNKNERSKSTLNIKNLQQILSTTKTRLKTIQDFVSDWDNIVNLLKFIVVEVGFFEEHHLQIKRGVFTCFIIACDKGHPDAEGIKNARWLTNFMIDHAETFSKRIMSRTPDHLPRHEYNAIKTLSEKLKKKWFLTKAESNYILQNIPFNCNCAELNTCCDQCLIIQKIKNNETLSVLEHRKILSLNVNEKCRKTVESLVIGSMRDTNKSKILECLLNRAYHLDKLLAGCRDHKQLVFKYRFDQMFRIIIEILICDVMNAFQEGWLVELANVRFSKMLSDLPLRNIIEHGNPLLEVVGSTLDPNDFPNALISFTLDFLQDKVYLQDLYKLYEDDVDRHNVYCSTDLSPEQLALTNNFKKCGRWKSYIKLLPTKRQTHLKHTDKTV